MPPKTKFALLWKVITTITRLAPFRLGKGGGIGRPTQANASCPKDVLHLFRLVQHTKLEKDIGDSVLFAK